jgi:hypothetical protein
MTEFLIAGIDEIIEDENPNYFKFEGKSIVPVTGEPMTLVGNKDSYYKTVSDFIEPYPLSSFSYATDIHKNELLIWSRRSKKLGIRQKIRII